MGFVTEVDLIQRYVEADMMFHTKKKLFNPFNLFFAI